MKKNKILLIPSLIIVILLIPVLVPVIISIVGGIFTFFLPYLIVIGAVGWLYQVVNK